MIFEDMKIARCVEDETILKESLMVDQEALINVPIGEIKDLPPPTITQAEVSKSIPRWLNSRD